MPIPHTTIGVIGGRSAPKAFNTLIAASALISSTVQPSQSNDKFASLSKEAQEHIVNALLGEYDGNPPELSKEVKGEIRDWVQEPDVEEK